MSYDMTVANRHVASINIGDLAAIDINQFRHEGNPKRETLSPVSGSISP